MSPTALRLDPKLKARIKKLAAKAGESPHSFMVKALEASVERAESREEWLESGRRADEAFERTRLGVPADEVHAWLRQVAKGSRAAPPKARVIPRKKSA